MRTLSALLALALVTGASAQSDFKQQISATDGFVAHGATSRWVKFTILESDPQTVHFQDSRRFAFHYDAVSASLPGYAGISRAEFDRKALLNQGRELLLGAVLFAPAPSFGGGIGGGFGGGFGPGLGFGPGIGGPSLSATSNDFGVQLVSTDELSLEAVERAFRAVVAAVDAGAGARGFYMPTPTQRAAVDRDPQFFQDRGIEVSDPGRWSEGAAVYAKGWALGRLVRLEPGEIDAAYADGRLSADDVLVTRGVPNDMPRVAGIVTLTPASDNSHVAILAQTWEIPFVHPQPDTIQAELDRLEGQRVLLRVGDGDPELFSMEHLEPALVARILELKTPGTIAFPAAERRGAPGATKAKDDLWLDTRGLTPADARFVGGKAAHFGILAEALPDHSPRAIGLTYDLYEAFFASDSQGTPLRERALTLMAKHQAILDAAGHAYPQDRLGELRADLAELREAIEDVRVPDALEDQVHEILSAHFPADQRLRFRSSSNLEDGEFSGAGLYDSASSRSPTSRVFRAIRRVYASFYTERAVLERLRHHVDEAQVFMGLAVHRSYPDEIELANGVATYHHEGGNSSVLELATQAGAASVVLPEGGAVAELVRLERFGGFTRVALERPSNLVPLGQHVLSWANEQAEYKQLAGLIERVAQRYAAVTGVESPQLDLEFKKLRENGVERFEIKQVRPLPKPRERSGAPFLVEPAARPTFSVFQGEQADEYALHRLQCELSLGLSGTGIQLTPQELGRSFLGNVRLRMVVDGARVELAGDPATWPGAEFTYDEAGKRARYSWDRAGQNPARMSLTVALEQVLREDAELLILDEATLWLEARYDRPVPSGTFGSPTTQQDAARLSARHEGDLPRGTSEHSLNGPAPGGLQVEGTVIFPPNPHAGGISAGYTAPLLTWKGDVVLEGLLPGERLVFDGHWSRTYRPDHHNFGYALALEPGLSGAITQAQRDRLAALEIVRIYVNSNNQAFTEDAQGVLTPWPRPAQPAGAAAPAAQPGTTGIEDALEDDE